MWGVRDPADLPGPRVLGHGGLLLEAARRADELLAARLAATFMA
jgi:hypothetical protein